MIFDAHSGWHLPDGEAHLQGWMRGVAMESHGRLTYQREKYLAALEHCPRRAVAVDVGAHVGLWSWQMSFDFDRVIAFEPMPAHRDCWRVNLADRPDCHLEGIALGAAGGMAWLAARTPGSSGDTGVEPLGATIAGAVPVDQRTLDSFHLPRCDLLKIDCEGYELFVLQGAQATLRRCRPTVIVEQKPETGMVARYGIVVMDAVELLIGIGYRVERAIQGDYIMTPPGVAQPGASA